MSFENFYQNIGKAPNTDTGKYRTQSLESDDFKSSSMNFNSYTADFNEE